MCKRLFEERNIRLRLGEVGIKLTYHEDVGYPFYVLYWEAGEGIDKVGDVIVRQEREILPGDISTNEEAIRYAIIRKDAIEGMFAHLKEKKSGDM